MAEQLGVGGKDREDFLQQVMLILALTNEIEVPGHYTKKTSGKVPKERYKEVQCAWV